MNSTQIVIEKEIVKNQPIILSRDLSCTLVMRVLFRGTGVIRIRPVLFTSIFQQWKISRLSE